MDEYSCQHLLPSVFIRENETSIEYSYEKLTRDSYMIFYELYRTESLCDIELIVQDTRIKCHRVILASASPYFRGMFTSQMSERDQRTVEIKEVSGAAVKNLVEFVYTQKVSVDPDNVQDLLFAATVLQFEYIVDACVKFLIDHMEYENCISIRNLADNLTINSLLVAAESFISEHFQHMSTEEDFLQLSFTPLINLISSPKLNVACESEVYESVIRWVKYDKITRSSCISALLEHVRLSMVSSEFLLSVVDQEPLVKLNPACRNLLDEAKNFHISTSIAFSTNPSQRMIPRESTAGLLFCIGGRGFSGDPFRSIEVFDPRANMWLPIPDMSTKRRHVGVTSIDSKVYAVGGHDGKRHLKSVEVFDPNTGKWGILTPMQTYRRGLAVASLGKALYAVGGLDDSSCFDNVERLDVTADSWSSVAPMNHRRGGAGVVALNGNLYAVGGNDGLNSLNNCEKYDPFLNKWSEITSMSVRRAGAGIAVFCGKIYVAGGFDDNAPLNSLECYCPKANSWTNLSPMLSCRGGVGLSALGGKLYAVGGHDGSSYLSTVEVYDVLANRWEVGQEINHPRAGAGVVTVFCSARKLREFTTAATNNFNKMNVQSFV